MLLDHNYNSSCRFAEDIVSYLYSEINTAEKLRFEEHLGTCQTCTDELAGFAFVRNSVLEWRQAAFSTMSTPQIEIPFEKDLQIHNLTSGADNSRSLIARLQDLLGISPGRLTVAVGFAALLVCAGLLYIVLNFQQNTKEIASDDNNSQSNIKVISVPVNENKEAKKIVSSGNNDKQLSREVKVTREAKSEIPPNTDKPVKVSSPAKPSPVKPQKLNINTVNKPVNSTQAKSSNKTRPTLTGDDEEEESLRLADLFKEVSMR